MASDRPIDLSPGWKGEPFLTVEEVQDTGQNVGAYVTLKHVRFLGAHTGCSCGFEYGLKKPQSDEDAEQDQAGRRSVAALREFIETQLQSGASLELLSRWFTEAFSAPAERLAVSPEYFGGESFELPYSALVQVRRAVEQRDEADEARER